MPRHFGNLGKRCFSPRHLCVPLRLCGEIVSTADAEERRGDAEKNKRRERRELCVKLLTSIVLRRAIDLEANR